MTTPLVSIVGAGPGDPSLISVRGLRRLSNADVIIHDHLVPRRLVQLASPEAEIIDVGAASPTKTSEQDAISILPRALEVR